MFLSFSRAVSNIGLSLLCCASNFLGLIMSLMLSQDGLPSKSLIIHFISVGMPLWILQVGHI